MDFFYMKDFLLVVKYYIETENPPKIYECVYPEKKTLLDIAKIINSMGDHSVNIVIEEKMKSESYVGNFKSLGIRYVGLEQGIKNVYEKLKLRGLLLTHQI